DARRRCVSGVPNMCPEGVRVLVEKTTKKGQFTGTLGKHSDVLEPDPPLYEEGVKVRCGAVPGVRGLGRGGGGERLSSLYRLLWWRSRVGRAVCVRWGVSF